MKNIIALSGSQLFPRVKIGVGDKPERWDLADWVLSRFTEDEQKAVEAAAKNTVDAVKLIVEDKTDEAMNRYNKVIK